MPFANGCRLFTVIVCPLKDKVPCEIVNAEFEPSQFKMIGREPKLTVPPAAPLMMADTPLPVAISEVLPLKV